MHVLLAAEVTPKTLSQSLAQCGQPIRSAHPIRPTVEDVFVSRIRAAQPSNQST